MRHLLPLPRRWPASLGARRCGHACCGGCQCGVQRTSSPAARQAQSIPLAQQAMMIAGPLRQLSFAAWGQEERHPSSAPAGGLPRPAAAGAWWVTMPLGACGPGAASGASSGPRPRPWAPSPSCCCHWEARWGCAGRGRHLASACQPKGSPALPWNSTWVLQRLQRLAEGGASGGSGGQQLAKGPR